MNTAQEIFNRATELKSAQNPVICLNGEDAQKEELIQYLDSTPNPSVNGVQCYVLPGSRNLVYLGDQKPLINVLARMYGQFKIKYTQNCKNRAHGAEDPKARDLAQLFEQISTSANGLLMADTDLMRQIGTAGEYGLDKMQVLARKYQAAPKFKQLVYSFLDFILDGSPTQDQVLIVPFQNLDPIKSIGETRWKELFHPMTEAPVVFVLQN